jgi:hypothetical protein
VKGSNLLSTNFANLWKPMVCCPTHAYWSGSKYSDKLIIINTMQAIAKSCERIDGSGVKHKYRLPSGWTPAVLRSSTAKQDRVHQLASKKID